MGTAMVFGAVWVGMVLMAGVPPRHVLVLFGLAVSLIPFAMLVVLGEYQRERIRLFFDPIRTPWAAASTSSRLRPASARAVFSAKG
jgi:cell division protein FtsW (lipid II flippase)